MKSLLYFVLGIIHFMVFFTLSYTIKLATAHDPDIKVSSVMFIVVLGVLCFIIGACYVSLAIKSSSPQLESTEGWDGD